MVENQWWKQSKAPVLLVRRNIDRRLAWQANEAALQWARQHEFDDSELDRLATDVGELGANHLDGALGHTPARRGEMHWHAVPWDDGWLAWCLPHSMFAPTPQEKLERLDILHHFGRIGMIGGDPGTGMALWDANAYRLWGFDADGARPSLQQLVDSIHADDRQRVADLLNPRSQPLGYTNERFRVCLRNGRVRHLHAMLKVVQGGAGQGVDLSGVIVDDTKTIERYLAQRKVAEEALNALELAGVGVWRQNLSGGKVIGDSVFHARMQVPSDSAEIDHEWVMAQHHPDDRDAAREANARALQTKEVVDAVLRVSGGDEFSHRTLLTRRVARRDAKGIPVELVGVSMDISALVRVNEQAQAWERRAELAAAASGVGFWYLDPLTGQGEWDRLMFQLHGRSAEQGTPEWSAWLEDYVEVSDRAEWNAQKRFGPDAVPYRGRCRINRADGEQRWVEITLQPESNPDARRWIAMIGDITDRIASSALLRIEQQRARFAADAASLGVWECSLDGMPLHWSEQMYALLGIKSKLQHRSLREWWYALRPVSARHQLERLIPLHAKRRDTLEHELQIIWHDGTVHWLALRARVLPGPSGQSERMHGVCWDVTQRRLAELEVRKTEVALADARARENVTAQLGHQLRTSLNTMLGFSELAAATSEVPTQVREWLDKVRSAGVGLMRQLEALATEPAPGPAKAELSPAPAVDLALPKGASTMLPLTVVCIEDNSLNLLLVENLIATRRHITLKSAENGRSGVQAVRELRPDLVLIDVRLPDIDGLEVLRQIRSDPLLASTRCIALSADNAPAEIERALEGGFDDYWTKPIDTAQFLGGLDALAQGKTMPKVALRGVLY
ncbi:MAG: PAS domain-containing protein [Burkholderiaceae bacterium]